MLTVLGAGFAFPETKIENSVLTRLGVGTADLECVGVTSRYSILPPSSFEQATNYDLATARRSVSETPTKLGARAASMAIERAGIQKEQIGLIVGECATPFETIPAESQRIANELGLKINAYDITSAYDAVTTLLETIAAWKVERTPEYILVVSTNTPTPLISYNGSRASAFLGDGAGALVVSMRTVGRYRVQNLASFDQACCTGRRTVITTALDFIDGANVAYEAPLADQAISDLASCGTSLPSSVIIPSYPSSVKVTSERLSSTRAFSMLEHGGNVLGSVAAILLGKHWDELGARARVIEPNGSWFELEAQTV